MDRMIVREGEGEEAANAQMLSIRQQTTSVKRVRRPLLVLDHVAALAGHARASPASTSRREGARAGSERHASSSIASHRTVPTCTRTLFPRRRVARAASCRHAGTIELPIYYIYRLPTPPATSASSCHQFFLNFRVEE